MPAPDDHGHSTKVEVELLEEALREAPKVYPSMKMKIFVDDIKMYLLGQNTELPKIIEEVPTKLKEESGKVGLFVSLTVRKKAGNSNMIASREYWEERQRNCGEREGVYLAYSVWTWVVDFRTRKKKLVPKREQRGGGNATVGSPSSSSSKKALPFKLLQELQSQ